MGPLIRAAELRALGYTSYRLGQHARARQHFERALGLFQKAGAMADTATAHSDLAVAAAAMNDHETARSHHEIALSLRRNSAPAADLAATLHNLGVTHRNLGNYDLAATHHHAALQVCDAAPEEAGALRVRVITSLGNLARSRGDIVQALQFHQQTLQILQTADRPVIEPLIGAHEALAADFTEAGNFARAEEHWRLALSLIQDNADQTRRNPAAVLNNLGVNYRNQRRLEAAAECFAAALKYDPALLAARHNLAAALSRLGRIEEASHHRNQALARENIFTQQATLPHAPRVLILSGADEGNVPLEHLLPEHAITRIWWFPAHGAARHAAALPDHELIFNGIGDPDMAAPAAGPIAAFLRGARKPVLNDPLTIEQTRRDRLAGTLADIGFCDVPTTLRFDAPSNAADVRLRCDAAGIVPPLLMRPVGAHGGAGLIRIDRWDELAQAEMPPGAFYVSPFTDYRSADGFFRKYRVIYIDRQPFPYHLAISPHWLVHYFSANMPDHAWKLAEEAAFLADWRAAIGPTAASVIADIGHRLNLDYCGIDFSVRAYGNVVVFEANATMLVHPEDEASTLAFKNPSVANIITAMQKLLTTRIKELRCKSQE